MTDATLYHLDRERRARGQPALVAPLQMTLICWQMALAVQAFWIEATVAALRGGK